MGDGAHEILRLHVVAGQSARSCLKQRMPQQNASGKTWHCQSLLATGSQVQPSAIAIAEPGVTWLYIPPPATSLRGSKPLRIS